MSRVHIAVIVALLAVFSAGPVGAALLERELTSQVYNTVAVLRHIHQELRLIEEKLEMVTNTIELTQKQYEAQKQLVDEEREKAEEADTDEEREKSTIRTEIFQVDLNRLENQIASLTRHNLEEAYRARASDLRGMVNFYQIQLEAKLLQFRVHFGREPQVSLDFEAEVSRFRQRDLGVTYLTIR